jgi:hypothetical protein
MVIGDLSVATEPTTGHRHGQFLVQDRQPRTAAATLVLQGPDQQIPAFRIQMTVGFIQEDALGPGGQGSG